MTFSSYARNITLCHSIVSLFVKISPLFLLSLSYFFDFFRFIVSSIFLNIIVQFFEHHFTFAFFECLAHFVCLFYTVLFCLFFCFVFTFFCFCVCFLINCVSVSFHTFRHSRFFATLCLFLPVNNTCILSSPFRFFWSLSQFTSQVSGCVFCKIVKNLALCFDTCPLLLSRSPWCLDLVFKTIYLQGKEFVMFFFHLFFLLHSFSIFQTIVVGVICVFVLRGTFSKPFPLSPSLSMNTTFLPVFSLPTFFSWKKLHKTDEKNALLFHVCCYFLLLFLSCLFSSFVLNYSSSLRCVNNSNNKIVKNSNDNNNIKHVTSHEKRKSVREREKRRKKRYSERERETAKVLIWGSLALKMWCAHVHTML